MALATPGVAFADRQTTIDPVGDMWTIGTPVPSSEMDIIKFKTNYDGQTIKMRATFAQLEMAGKSQVLMAALAPNNRALVAAMNYDGLEPTWGLRELSLPNGRIAIVRRVDCTAVNGHINLARRTITMIISAECFARPSQIKTLALTRATVEGGDRRDGADYSTVSPVFAGPWIHR